MERRRLEIVHESLLTHWPRLMRWHAQDAEGAVLRDQLRQAAHLWDQRKRADDFLWTGTAHREYQLWRERYPGGLTTLEETFARASTALAHRRRRRRNTAVAAAFLILATGLVVVAVLRQQAVAEARRAAVEARRAEASKLLALGRVELEANPTVALAYAIKSLEVDDSLAARVFAVEALAAGPPAFLHPVLIRRDQPARQVLFSRDGAWAAVLGEEKVHVVGQDGRAVRSFEPFPSGTGRVSAAFDGEARHLYAAKDGLVRVWSVPAFQLTETHTIGGTFTRLRTTPTGVMAATRLRDEPRQDERISLAVGSLPQRLNRIEGIKDWTIDPSMKALAFARDKGLYVRSLADANERPHRIGTYEGRPDMRFHPAGDLLASYDGSSREIRLWSASGGGRPPVRAFTTPFEPLSEFTFDLEGKRLAAVGATDRGLRVNLWSLDAPVDAAPRSFPATFGDFLYNATFTPDGRWLATAQGHAICFWPIGREGPVALLGHKVGVTDVRFTPDSRRLVSVDREGEVREWDLAAGGSSRTLARLNYWSVLDVDPRGRFVAVTQRGGAGILPLGGGAKRALGGFVPATFLGSVAIDREGRRVAAASGIGPRSDKVIRVWDLETGEVWTLGPTEAAGDGRAGQTFGLGFLADGSVVSVSDGGLRRWSVASGAHEIVAPHQTSSSHLTVFPDGRSVVYKMGTAREEGASPESPVASIWVAVTDFVTRKTRVLTSHGGRVMSLGVDPSGRIIVSGGLDGIVRVGPVTGEEPYLLMGAKGSLHTVDISPDGRWVAAGGDDRTIRIWPMPDMSKPPLHTLPLDQLLTKLKSLTNVRVVESSASTISAFLRTERGSGYEIDLEPFRGWARAPD